MVVVVGHSSVVAIAELFERAALVAIGVFEHATVALVAEFRTVVVVCGCSHSDGSSPNSHFVLDLEKHTQEQRHDQS